MSLQEALTTGERAVALEGAGVRTPLSAALDDAAARLDKEHSVDIRFSAPVFGHRYYVSVLADRERRRPTRRFVERAVHPLWTVGNLFFMMAMTGSATVLAMLGVLVVSAIVRF
jgi:hypothetical protein